jgi:hypothetical protein
MSNLNLTSFKHKKTSKRGKQVFIKNLSMVSGGTDHPKFSSSGKLWNIFRDDSSSLDVNQKLSSRKGKAVYRRQCNKKEISCCVGTTTTGRYFDNTQVGTEMTRRQDTADLASNEPEYYIDNTSDDTLKNNNIVLPESDCYEDIWDQGYDRSIAQLDDKSLLAMEAWSDPNYVLDCFIRANMLTGCILQDIAAIKDIRLQSPVYPEVYELLRQKRGELEGNRPSTLLQMTQFFDKNFELIDEFRSIWEIIVDIFRSVILYGYKIKKEVLRLRMVKVWLSWSYKTAKLDASKVLYDQTYTASRWCKVVKYKLAAFAAYAKCEAGQTIYPKSPLTVPDNPKIILDREFAHWFDSLPEGTIIEKLGRMSLIDTICRGVKKGANRASQDDCTINRIETYDLFTTEKPLVSNVVLEPRAVFTLEDDQNKHLPNYTFIDITGPKTLEPIQIEQEIIRSIDEVLQGCKPFEMQYGHSPSFAASTNSSRQRGGHMAEIRSLAPFKKVVDSGISVDAYNVMLRNPLPVPFANETENPDPLCRSPLKSSDPELLGAIQHGELRATMALGFSLSGLGTDLDIDELCELSLSKSSVIKPIALKEALKVRGITTPDALESWLLKPLQKKLSKQLALFDVFKVTSTPLTKDHIKKVFSKILPGQSIISGDYDNATNMILVHYTRVCLTHICNKLELSELLTKVAIRSLCDNVVSLILDPHCGADEAPNMREHQKCAQPMGKVLSFVVLCLLNFSVCRLAYELDSGIPCTIKEFPGLINGDDVFFPIRSVQTWVQCAGMVGLVNSIGKTFVSRPGETGKRCRCFIEMNSRSFIVECSNLDDLQFFEVPFINFGLMKGLIRSENTADSTIISQTACAIAKMGACHSELTLGFDSIFDELDYLFRGYHRTFLESDLLRGVPFYIPKWLGGLGLNPGPRYYERIPEIHRKGASVLFSKYDDIKKRPKAIVDAKTCMIDDLITKNVKDTLEHYNAPIEVHHQDLEGPDGIIYDLKHENIKVYNLLVEEVWRTEWEQTFFVQHKNKKSASAFKKESEKLVAKKLRHNSKLWTDAHAVALNTHVQPLPFHKLWHRKFDSYWPLFLIDESTKNRTQIREIENSTPKFRECKVTILPPEILDRISYFLRMVQHQDSEIIITSSGNFDQVRRSFDERSIILRKHCNVTDHGVVKHRAMLLIEDIEYRNPFMNGSLSYARTIYGDPDPIQYNQGVIMNSQRQYNRLKYLYYGGWAGNNW